MHRIKIGLVFIILVIGIMTVNIIFGMLKTSLNFILHMGT